MNSEASAEYSIVAVERFIQATRDSGYKGTPSAVAELIDNSPLIPTWDAQASYQVGDVVTFNGTTYECVQDYVGVGDPNYINALSLWQPLP